MGRSYYDDNYGFYDIRDQDDIDFYFETQKQSVKKKCAGCGRTVKIKPDYAYCNSCTDKLERGFDVS
jgi:rRNA maturation endonuclease Nob1